MSEQRSARKERQVVQQNIYDDETFFEGYRRLRGKEGNANVLFEMPALFSLLPDLAGKRVLDLGCGFGEHCAEFVRRGAARVLGIDISEKMLEVARRDNADARVEYRRLAMEDLGELAAAEERFDVAVSSLALHYVEDFAGVLGSVHRLLEDGGIFVFSQEHPLTTSHSVGDRWTRDVEGRKLFAHVADYGREGLRETTWFVGGVQKYHRMFSTIMNSLISAGFEVERVVEPLPTEELLEQYPRHADLFHKPDFLVVRARKHLPAPYL